MTVRALTRWLSLAAVLVSCLAESAPPRAEDAFRPQDFAAKASFQLMVNRSKVLRPGPSAVMAKSAVATRLHGLRPGNSEGLELLFLTQRITDATGIDVLEKRARQLRQLDHAAFMLYLDKQGTLRQVDLSYVIPGTTVARTVAWRPEDLTQFSSYRFDGKRVLLKSKGLSRDTGPDEELTLSWDVDVDLPVLDRATP